MPSRAVKQGRQRLHARSAQPLLDCGVSAEGCRLHVQRCAADNPALQGKYTLKSEGTAFTIGKGQGLSVAAASLGLLLRFGTGALTAGYKAGLKDKSDAEYGLGAAGKAVKETSVRCCSGRRRPCMRLIGG